MALAASFAMGANDVANATAVFVSTGLTGVVLAGGIGGIALAVGVLTWGGRLLSTVATDIVTVDRPMAIAAQSAQAAVILTSVVLLGAFTSMNQALVGGMAGAGLARGQLYDPLAGPSRNLARLGGRPCFGVARGRGRDHDRPFPGRPSLALTGSSSTKRTRCSVI